jgi:hypothetical protein
VDQLDVAAHQVHERANAFLIAARALPDIATPAAASAESWGMPDLGASGAEGSLTQQVLRARDLVRNLARDGAYQQAHAVYELAEQAYLASGRLSQLISQGAAPGQPASERATQAQLGELRTLSEVLTQLGYVAQSARQQTGTQLGALEAALDQIGTLTVRAVGREASPAWLGAAPGTPPVDLVRLAGAFAHDVGALARQILHISAEMREGLTPFRLEAGPGGDLGQFGQMGQMGQFGPVSGPNQPPLLDAGGPAPYRPRWDAPPPSRWD